MTRNCGKRGMRGRKGAGRLSGGGEHVYGRQPVREVLRAGRRKVMSLWIRGKSALTPDLAEILDLARESGVTIYETDYEELDRLSAGGNHQGIVIHAESYPYIDFDAVTELVRQAGDDALLLCLDHLEDVQNVGALLRSAEAAGVTAVLIAKDRAARVTAAALRASAGAAEYVPVAIVVNIVQALRQLKKEGIWIAGLEAGPQARMATESDLTGPWCLVIGAEGSGLGRLVRHNCDLLISLPLYGQVASLNAGVAAALALYEVQRQRADCAAAVKNAISEND